MLMLQMIARSPKVPRYIFLLGLLFTHSLFALPKPFVYLDTIDPSIVQDIRYATSYNFIGRPLKGYVSARCILTKPAALRLAQIQHELKPYHLGLKVFDCYRPERAVHDIISWSRDGSDQKMKAYYYPHINKADLYRLNYLAYKSSHARGSTVDLTLVQFIHQKSIDIPMGTRFDYLDAASHFSAHFSKQIHSNRQLLRSYMTKNGFTPIYTEWWHFSLSNEPFNQYFDFVVK